MYFKKQGELIQQEPSIDEYGRQKGLIISIILNLSIQDSTFLKGERSCVNTLPTQLTFVQCFVRLLLAHVDFTSPFQIGGDGLTYSVF